MAMLHVGAATEHWLELWTGIGTGFLRLQNVPTLYVLQNCTRAVEENCRYIKRPFIVENCDNCYIKRDGTELVE
jgi:hypothetical protein